MTWAHILSISRVVAAIPMAILILCGHGNTDFWAAVLFACASLTDLLDGPMARRGRSVSPFGIYLDTTGDKVLVSVVLIALATANLVSAWIAMVIIGREFLVTGVRTLASVSGIVVPANFAGKVKTTVTLIAIVFVLVVSSAREGGFFHGVGGLSVWWMLSNWAMVIAAILTIYSGVCYIVDARSLFRSPELSNDGLPT